MTPVVLEGPEQEQYMKLQELFDSETYVPVENDGT